MARRRTAKQAAASRANGKKRKKYRGRYSNNKTVNRSFHTASVVLAGASIGFKYANYKKTKNVKRLDLGTHDG